MIPQLSVLMPVRHAADTVLTAVNSVRAQTFADWELVVIADGPDAATADCLRQLAAEEPRLRLLSTPPHGIASALITGCAACQGDAIARMDADDWMHPQRLELQWQHLQTHPDTGLVSCRVTYGGKQEGYATHVDWINSLTDHDAMSLNRFVEAPVAHPSVMFRRHLIATHDSYRVGDFPEDYELWLRWLDAGVRFAKLPDTLLTWSDLPNRLSRTDPRYDVAAFYRLKLHYLADWLRRHVDGERQRWLWGAGRVTRRRFEALEAEGFPFTGYIDVDPAKQGRLHDGRSVRSIDDLPPREQSFIIAGVANRGARELIRAHLLERGWREGRDFLLAA